MASAILALSLIACVLTPARALQVTPNSVCAKVCIDNPSANVSDPNASNTYGSDIVCNDNDYVTMPVGQKFRQCLDCLQNSTASSTTENDQAWFLYNLRYAFNTCVFAAANASDPISTPCSTDTICAPLQGGLELGMSSPATMSQYGYCSANNNTFLGPNLNACEECLRENNNLYYLSNFLVALDAGCIQQPPAGTLVGLNGTLFQSNQVAIVAPVTSSSAQKHSKPLTIGAIIGIAVGGVVLLLIIGATVFVCMKKRRNARRLKHLQSPLDERFGAPEISAPNKGAFASPQTSPVLDKESISLQMKRSPKIRNFSFSSQQPLRAGEWTGSSSTSSTPATIIATSPPGYTPSNRSARSSIPTHHAYIPPEYSPPPHNSISPNFTPSPLIRPPSAPPQHLAQDSPSSFITTHRTSPSVTSIRTKTPVNGTTAISPPLPGQTIPRSPSRTGFRTTTPAPTPISISRTPSRMQNRATMDPNTIGAVDISGPIVKVGSRFENEEVARKARERLYREGLVGRTMTHGKDEERREWNPDSERREWSPDSESESGREELWPGSY